MCTALYMQNPKMSTKSIFKADKMTLRTWIGKLQDAFSELKAKLEDDGVIPTQPILRTLAEYDLTQSYSGCWRIG